MRQVIKIMTKKPVGDDTAAFLRFNGFHVLRKKPRTYLTGLPEDFSDLMKRENLIMSPVINDISLKFNDGDYSFI